MPAATSPMSHRSPLPCEPLHAFHKISSLLKKPAVKGTPERAAVAIMKVSPVFGMLHGVDDASRAQEQTGLEESVGHEMKDTGSESAYPAGKKHVAKLRHGGVGENSLDVVLHQTDGSGEDRGHRSHHRNDGERPGSGPQ